MLTPDRRTASSLLPSAKVKRPSSVRSRMKAAHAATRNRISTPLGIGRAGMTAPISEPVEIWVKPGVSLK